MTKPRQTLTVIGPHGSEVTVLKPGLGKVIVITHSGATVRGMRFYHPTLLNVSDHYARFLAGKLAAENDAIVMHAVREARTPHLETRPRDHLYLLLANVLTLTEVGRSPERTHGPAAPVRREGGRYAVARSDHLLISGRWWGWSPPPAELD